MFVVRFCSQGKVLAVHLAFKKNSGHFLHLDSFFSSFVSSLLAFLPLESLCFYYFCITLIIMFCYCGQIMICK